MNTKTETENTKETVELYGPDGDFPVAIASAIEAANVAIPNPPPITGRNPGVCFSMSSFDEARLGEVLAFLDSIGFVVQSATVARKPRKFGVATISFGQVGDPRVEGSDNLGWDRSSVVLPEDRKPQ